MNPFQCDYTHRLREWKNLRLMIKQKPIDQICVEVDKWWQQAPLIAYHIHPQDCDNWPDPWTMLSENIYCPLTRALGICYTLFLCEILTVNVVQAVDAECAEHNLVIVGNAKYVLNYYPDSVLSTNLNEFKINKELSLEKLKTLI